MSLPAARAPHPSEGRPASLGRYRIERELGRGAQGCVYLAEDAQLERKVAIKTLAPGVDAGRAATLLAEARTTARLQHPNIVTLHDAFEHDGLLCVVLEYVPCETLERLLRKSPRLEVRRAVAITAQVLDALAYAHERGIVHRDIKPANILIDSAGNARVSDFGIAALVGAADTFGAGTPRYMAPESFDKRIVACGTDVFAVGMTLYEMLAGRPAVEARNIFEALHKIANEPITPPSAYNTETDDGLEQIVMRAIAKDPAERYGDAGQMRLALEQHLRPATDAGADSTETGGSAAIEFLLTRMRHKSSFPALSTTISAINRLTAGYEKSIQALSDVLLKDFALTNKLLKIVNSTGYGHFGGTISTISRAVMIIGFDAVRDLAVTLVLIEHLQNKGQATRLRDDVIASLLTGILARRIAHGIGLRDAEEGFICGVFRHLGRLLASFYLYEESVEIARRIEQTQAAEAQASRAVLGASYDEIGIAVARSWNLPASIVASMRPLGDPSVKSTAGANRLQVTASLAQALTEAAIAGSPTEREQRVGEIALRFRDAIKLDPKQLKAIAAEGVHELLDGAGSLLGDARKSRFCQHLRQTAGEAPKAPSAASDGLDRIIEQTSAIMAPAIPGGECEPAQVLAAGIQDITNSLVDNFNLSDVLRIILETMYRGMGFARVILFMRSPGAATLTARFGYGAGMEQITSRLGIPFGRDPDVFSVALAKNVDVLISDIDAENIRARIPAWYRSSGLGAAFVLLPIVIDAKPVGLFFGDKAQAGELTIEQRELSLLKTLRNQAVLALRQRR
jgi:serine/threonine protein kinase